VTIGAREGKGYAGMPASRAFCIRWITPGRPLDLDGAADATVAWQGKPVTISRPRLNR
jgi:alpha-D-xyloside xylohydrolase